MRRQANSDSPAENQLNYKRVILWLIFESQINEYDQKIKKTEPDLRFCTNVVLRK